MTEKIHREIYNHQKPNHNHNHNDGDDGDNDNDDDDNSPPINIYWRIDKILSFSLFFLRARKKM